MPNSVPRSIVTLGAICSLAFQVTAAEAIGVVMAGGAFRVDGNPVTGNATLFDGTRVETEFATSDLELRNGARMRLATGSRARVYSDRLVLEKGSGILQRGVGYHIEASGLRILPEGAGASAVVAVTGERSIAASVAAGSVRVTTSGGSVVALMGAGRSLDFELLPQVPGAQVPFQMTGCLEVREGRYVLRDIVSGVMEEVRGQRLDREVGNMVEVTAHVLPGVQPVAGAMEVIQITQLRRVSRGCPAGAPPKPAPVKPAPPKVPEPAPPKPVPAPEPSAPAPAKPAPAPPVVTKRPGMSGIAKAVIAGVLVGGGGAAAAVFATRKKEEGPISP